VLVECLHDAVDEGLVARRHVFLCGKQSIGDHIDEAVRQRRRHPEAPDGFGISGPKDARVTTKRGLKLAQRTVFALWIDEAATQLVATQPLGDQKNLTAGGSYQVRHPLMLVCRGEKARAMRIESA